MEMYWKKIQCIGKRKKSVEKINYFVNKFECYMIIYFGTERVDQIMDVLGQLKIGLVRACLVAPHIALSGAGALRSLAVVRFQTPNVKIAT